MAYKSGKRYPGVKGKVVELAEHSFAEGRLFIRVRFQDKTELCWQIDCALTLRMADLSDWKTGNWKHLETFVKNDQDGEL
ncbi:MAG TPA: hypothetical protein VNX66_07300 [Candidatus Sulfotelmatobacter sp.]|nr:hypothetical protein [Candidatus Sulfotelmatobacter sp.]